MSDSEFDEAKFKAEIEEIHKQFPNARFSIDLSLDEIDSVVSNTDQLAIKCVFNCYCYSEAPRNSEFYICKNPKGKDITNRDLVECLIENKFAPDCDHRFLEIFEVNNSSQVTAWFGS